MTFDLYRLRITVRLLPKDNTRHWANWYVTRVIRTLLRHKLGGRWLPDYV